MVQLVTLTLPMVYMYSFTLTLPYVNVLECAIYIYIYIYIYTLGDLPISKFTLIICRCIPKLNAISAMGCFDQTFKILIPLNTLPKKKLLLPKPFMWKSFLLAHIWSVQDMRQNLTQLGHILGACCSPDQLSKNSIPNFVHHHFWSKLLQGKALGTYCESH